MFKIVSINEEYKSLAKKFLLSVPSIKEIDEDVFSNAILVLDDNNIVGSIAYEEFNDAGLIRYFVFKKILSESLVKELFLNLENKARENKIVRLFCVVDDKNIESLFLGLDFSYVEKNKVFIDEQPFEELEYGSSNIMIKTL